MPLASAPVCDRHPVGWSILVTIQGGRCFNP